MTLILKRASASRPSGEWDDDDFDVLADGVVVGRIIEAAAAPVGLPWMWTLIFDYHEDRSRRTATRPRARPRWPRSRPKAGGGSRRSGAPPVRAFPCPLCPSAPKNDARAAFPPDRRGLFSAP
jgi:hypothetical protein